MVCSLCLLADLIPVLKTVIFKNSIVPDQTASEKAADQDPHCVCLFDKCVLLKDHNALTPLRLEPAAPRSQVKHSTTEPLRSLFCL